MKKYYVKIGNMYLRDIYTSSEALQNNFVREIDLRFNNENAYIINEDEKTDIINIFCNIFKTPTIGNSITFEEMKEDE